MNKTLTTAQVEAAKAAGFHWHTVGKCLVVRHSSGAWVAVDEMLAHFAALLAANPGRPEPRHSITNDERDKIERAEERLRGRGPEDVAAANELLDVLTAHPPGPEPRAEVTDDDKADAERYRLLKSIPFGPGVPAVYRGIAFSFAVSTGKPGFIRSCRGDEMDAAIDAARAGEGQ
jgi:hypothetical protein